MAKAATLRPGLTVEDLKKGRESWVGPNRYKTMHELEDVVDDAVNMVLQAFIDRANAGERIHSKVISNTCCTLADALKALKDSINDRLRSGELIPSVLDELAAVTTRDGADG